MFISGTEVRINSRLETCLRRHAVPINVCFALDRLLCKIFLFLYCPRMMIDQYFHQIDTFYYRFKFLITYVKELILSLFVFISSYYYFLMVS